MSPGNDDRLSNRTRAGRWTVEFPFEWDADDLVSRRQMLRWAVWASGALFVATGVLAGLGLTRDHRRSLRRQVAQVEDVPVGGAHYFNYPGEDDFAVMLRLSGERFVAYSGVCTHLSCAVYWNAERGILHCPCHEGVFSPETGGVLAGPPPRPLPKILLEVQDGVVYAVEEVPE